MLACLQQLGNQICSADLQDGFQFNRPTCKIVIQDTSVSHPLLCQDERQLQQICKLQPSPRKRRVRSTDKMCCHPTLLDNAIIAVINMAVQGKHDISFIPIKNTEHIIRIRC